MNPWKYFTLFSFDKTCTSGNNFIYVQNNTRNFLLQLKSIAYLFKKKVVIKPNDNCIKFKYTPSYVYDICRKLLPSFNLKMYKRYKGTNYIIYYDINNLILKIIYI